MSDQALDRLEARLGRLLLAGVLCSASVLFVGLVLAVLNVATPLAADLLYAGLLMLMATPILRVVVSLVEFVLMRDWFFVVTTLAVVGVLFVSIVVALTEP